MRSRRPVEAAQLEAVDRVWSVSVIPLNDDWDPTIPCDLAHVARRDLPAPGQLLGSQQLGSGDGAHNVPYECLPRLAARNPQRVQTEPHAGGLITPIRLPEKGQLGFWMTRRPARHWELDC